MKGFISCLFLLPVLTSCVDQGRYYAPDYYSPPPPPRIESHPHQQHGHQSYEETEAPRVRVDRHQRTYHNSERTQHGHASGSKVIVHGSTEGRY